MSAPIPAAGLALSESQRAAGDSLLGTLAEFAAGALGAPGGRDSSLAPDFVAESSACPAPHLAASARGRIWGEPMGAIDIPHIVAWAMLAGVAACAFCTFILTGLRVAFGRRHVEAVFRDGDRP